MADFTGFPPQTQRFLRALARNNNKEWFDAHRSDYEDYWVAPAKEFVAAAGEALQEIAPVEAQPKVNGSIFTTAKPGHPLHPFPGQRKSTRAIVASERS